MNFPNPKTQFKPGNNGGPGRPRKRRPITSVLIELYNRRDELSTVNFPALKAYLQRINAVPIETEVTGQSEPGAQLSEAGGSSCAAPTDGPPHR